MQHGLQIDESLYSASSNTAEQAPEYPQGGPEKLAEEFGVGSNTLRYSDDWDVVRQKLSPKNAQQTAAAAAAANAKRKLAKYPQWCDLPIGTLATKLGTHDSTLRYHETWQSVRDKWEELAGRSWPTKGERWPPNTTACDKALLWLKADPDRCWWPKKWLAAEFGIYQKTLSDSPVWAPLHRLWRQPRVCPGSLPAA